jgi:hypothetical protein
VKENVGNEKKETVAEDNSEHKEAALKNFGEDNTHRIEEPILTNMDEQTDQMNIITTNEEYGNSNTNANKDDVKNVEVDNFAVNTHTDKTEVNAVEQDVKNTTQNTNDKLPTVKPVTQGINKTVKPPGFAKPIAPGNIKAPVNNVKPTPNNTNQKQTIPKIDKPIEPEDINSITDKKVERENAIVPPQNNAPLENPIEEKEKNNFDKESLYSIKEDIKTLNNAGVTQNKPSKELNTSIGTNPNEKLEELKKIMERKRQKEAQKGTNKPINLTYNFSNQIKSTIFTTEIEKSLDQENIESIGSSKQVNTGLFDPNENIKQHEDSHFRKIDNSCKISSRNDEYINKLDTFKTPLRTMGESNINPLDLSMNKSIYSTRDNYDKIKSEVKVLRENKLNLETTLEIALKKNEVYEKEIKALKDNLSEIKLTFSKINEETMKLEISKLNTCLSSKDKEIELLNKENELLKKSVKNYQHNIEAVLDENKKFRDETERKFEEYRHQIELLRNENKNSSNNKNESITELRETKKAQHYQHVEVISMNQYVEEELFETKPEQNFHQEQYEDNNIFEPSNKFNDEEEAIYEHEKNIVINNEKEDINNVESQNDVFGDTEKKADDLVEQGQADVFCNEYENKVDNPFGDELNQDEVFDEEYKNKAQSPIENKSENGVQEQEHDHDQEVFHKEYAEEELNNNNPLNANHENIFENDTEVAEETGNKASPFGIDSKENIEEQNIFNISEPAIKPISPKNKKVAETKPSPKQNLFESSYIHKIDLLESPTHKKGLTKGIDTAKVADTKPQTSNNPFDSSDGAEGVFATKSHNVKPPVFHKVANNTAANKGRVPPKVNPPVLNKVICYLSLEIKFHWK